MGTNNETTTAFISKSIPELTRNCRAKILDKNSNKDDNKFDIRWELHKKKLECVKANEQICELQNKIDNLRIEWRSQQEHLGKLNQEYIQLQQTLGEHSIYCATLGATMGSLLWKVSRIDGAIESILESNRINQMLIIMDNSLKAFIEVFGHDIPDPYGNEYQFVLSWMGILTNISASPDGRYYLLNKPEGSQLITHLIEGLQKLSHHNGVLLQRMILMILYNLMINTNGVMFMQHHTQFTTILTKTLLNCKNDIEIQDLIYKLIHALTQNIHSNQYLKYLKDTLPWTHIETTICDRQSPNQEIAKKIKTNCKNMENQLKMEKMWNNRPEDLIVGMSLDMSTAPPPTNVNSNKKSSQKISSHTFVKTSKTSIHCTANVINKDCAVSPNLNPPRVNVPNHSENVNSCLWANNKKNQFDDSEINKIMQGPVIQRNSYKLEDDFPPNTECIFSKNITLTTNIITCDDITNPINMIPNKDTNINIKKVEQIKRDEDETESEKCTSNEAEISNDTNNLLYTINKIITTDNYITKLVDDPDFKLEEDPNFKLENSIDNDISQPDQDAVPKLKKRYHCKHLCTKKCELCTNK